MYINPLISQGRKFLLKARDAAVVINWYQEQGMIVYKNIGTLGDKIYEYEIGAVYITLLL